MSHLTQEERRALTHRAFALLDDWRLAASEISAILALPEHIKPRAIPRFREGEPLPDDHRVDRRVAYLLRIEEALRTYFPRNPEMRKVWVRRGTKQFGRRTPLAVMLEDGDSGLIAVLSHLDCTFAWDLTGSKAEYRTA